MKVFSPRMTSLPMPARPDTLYWDERVGGWWNDFPRACQVCIGGRLDATPPNTPTSGPGVVACLNCGREAAEVLETRPAPPRPLTAEELAPKRGPKPKTIAPPPPRPAADLVPCADCGTPRVWKRGARCHPCLEVYRARYGTVARLVALLERGEPVRRDTLANELGVTLTALRKAVGRARERGHLVISVSPRSLVLRGTI